MSESNRPTPNRPIRNRPILGQRESPIDAQLAAPPAATDTSYSRPPFRPPSSGGELLQSRAAVFVALFLVTGALGIPLLWVNRNFSTTERIVWTIIVTIYTVGLLAFLAWFIWWWVYKPLFG